MRAPVVNLTITPCTSDPTTADLRSDITGKDEFINDGLAVSLTLFVALFTDKI